MFELLIPAKWSLIYGFAVVAGRPNCFTTLAELGAVWHQPLASYKHETTTQEQSLNWIRSNTLPEWKNHLIDAFSSSNHEDLEVKRSMAPTRR